MADYDKAIQLNPADSYTYLSRGNLYAFKDNNEKAKTDYQKVIELGKDPTQVKQAQDKLAQIK